MQSPIAASAAPRVMSALSNEARVGGSTGAISARHENATKSVAAISRTSRKRRRTRRAMGGLTHDSPHRAFSMPRLGPVFAQAERALLQDRYAGTDWKTRPTAPPPRATRAY